jgi:hypothetical protein
MRLRFNVQSRGRTRRAPTRPRRGEPPLPGHHSLPSARSNGPISHKQQAGATRRSLSAPRSTSLGAPEQRPVSRVVPVRGHVLAVTGNMATRHREWVPPNRPRRGSKRGEGPVREASHPARERPPSGIVERLASMREPPQASSGLRGAAKTRLKPLRNGRESPEDVGFQSRLRNRSSPMA